MRAFESIKVENLEVKNRIVMPPMCMYSANTEGYANEFHNIHYGSRAVGGVGLIILEATSVTSNGRISEHDLGIWEDGHIEGLKRIVTICQLYGSKMVIQLAHAGRKCGVEKEEIVAPSGIPFNETSRVPRELSKEEIKQIIAHFKEGAIRAVKAGFNGIEIHAAHGYLIHEFLSPITNKRQDEYGGNVSNRTRFLREILEEVREALPSGMPIFLRVSASDYTPDGLDVYQMEKIIHEVRDLIDVLDVSSGGVIQAKIDVYNGYQVRFSEYLKSKCNVPTIAVGLITGPELVEEVLFNNRADFVALGRELLRNPYWVLDTAYENHIPYEYPKQYIRAFHK